MRSRLVEDEVTEVEEGVLESIWGKVKTVGSWGLMLSLIFGWTYANAKIEEAKRIKPINHENGLAVYMPGQSCEITAKDPEVFREMTTWCLIKVTAQADIEDVTSPDWVIENPLGNAPAR